jgi:hypothetical protein
MRSFEEELGSLTASFAGSLILAVKRAALEEVARVVAEIEAENAAPRTRRAALSRQEASPPPSTAQSRRGRSADERLLEYVKGHPGERSEKVRAALGFSRSEMQALVKKLLAVGKLKGEGDRRATRYFVR